MSVYFCVIKFHLILHRRQKVSFLSPVDGVWMWCVAAEVVPFCSRAVLQRAVDKNKNNVNGKKNISSNYVKYFLYACHYLWLRPKERLFKFPECHV